MYPWKTTLQISPALLLVAVSLLATSVTHAQDTATPDKKQELPKAEDVLEAYVKAIGGREALEKHTSLVITMKGKVVEQGISITLKTKQKAPNLMRQEMSLVGAFKQEMGFDGKVAWSKEPFTGERELEGVERAQAVHQATFNADLKWKELYKSVKTLGIEKVDDRECVVVQLTPEEGHPTKNYYDRETHLLLVSETKSESAMGEQSARARVLDYKKVGGVLYPHTTRAKVGPQTIQLTVEKIEWDVKLDNAIFHKPWAKKDQKEKKKDDGKNGQS